MQLELILDSNSLRSLYHRSIASKPISHHSTHFLFHLSFFSPFVPTSTLDSTNNIVRSIILLHDAIKIDRIRTHALPHDVILQSYASSTPTFSTRGFIFHSL